MERAVLDIPLYKVNFYFSMQLIDSISTTSSLELMEAQTHISQQNISTEEK